MADRIISLSVGTREDEEWKHAFELLSQIGAEMGMTHHYASVSSTLHDPTAIVETEDELYHDEETLFKVRAAIDKALRENVDAATRSYDIINELQNAGILFRERR